MTPQLQLDDEGHNVLSACLQYWSSEPLPEIERVVCYSWVRRLYRDTFGLDLKRAAFDRVAKLGFLAKADTARGGGRRYYRLVAPALFAR